MKNFQLVASCPEVIGAVVSDAEGALVEFSGDIDAESTGAVMTYAAQALAKAGEHLGLGILTRAVVSGPRRACVITTAGDVVLGVYVDATKPVSAFEKKLDDLLRR
jgi:predicted regulator of Ras-like GTPase activity (Roadblock/LC7/MglB family)